jgi:hypothetical protein
MIRRRFRPSPLGRSGSLAVCFIALSLTLLLLPQLSLGANSFAGTLVLSKGPPYPGAAVASWKLQYLHGCGGTAGIPQTPTINATTGTVRFSTQANASSCPSSFALSRLDFKVAALASDFTVAHAGWYNLTSTWRVSGTFDYNVTYNSTPNGSISVNYYVRGGFDYLLNGSAPPVECGTPNDGRAAQGYRTAGAGAVNVSFTVSPRQHSWYLSPGYHYRVEFCLSAQLSAYVTQGTLGSATTTMDFASAGHGATFVRFRLFD